jgi:hypothetical protein
MPLYYILNEKGEPVPSTPLESADWIGHKIAHTETIDKRLSTVFLSISHGLDNKGRPYLFESMFWRDGAEEECLRYATLADAVQGHKNLLKRFFDEPVVTEWGEVTREKVEPGPQPDTVWQRILDD